MAMITCNFVHAPCQRLAARPWHIDTEVSFKFAKVMEKFIHDIDNSKAIMSTAA